MSEAPSVIIDIGDNDKNGMFTNSEHPTPARVGGIVRFDGIPQRVKLVRKSQDPDRDFDDVNITGATVEFAVGVPDQQPTSGTFSLTYNGATGGLTDLPYNISATALAAAINANAAVIADGGLPVTVKQYGSSYVVMWTGVGAKHVFAANGDGLAPLCDATVSEVQAGTASRQEMQVIKLAALPYGYSDSYAPSAAGAITVTSVQVGDPGKKEVQKLTWNATPYAGTFTVNLGIKETTSVTCKPDTAGALNGKGFQLQDVDGSVGIWLDEGASAMPAIVAASNRFIKVTITSGDTADQIATDIKTALDADAYYTTNIVNGYKLEIADGQGGSRANADAGDSTFVIGRFEAGASYSVTVPYNATEIDLENGFGGYFTVKATKSGFTLTAVNPGTSSLVTVEDSDLVYPVFLEGEVNCNTFSTFMAFATTTADNISAVFEAKVTFPGKQPYTFYREQVTIYRNVIDLSTMSPAVRPGFVGINFRIKADGTGQFYNPDNNLWYTVRVRGAEPGVYLEIVTPGEA